ncbi:unnamed protein product, partial [Polarella glacialis]
VVVAASAAVASFIVCQGLAALAPSQHRGPVRVALTRQAGENGKLQKALKEALLKAELSSDLADVVEVPCIEHARGPDFSGLEALLAKLTQGDATSDELNSVVLTSPQAVKVFAEAWSPFSSGASLPLSLASVGSGTSAAARAAGLRVDFEPSVANAETLAAELPGHLGPRILYPASAIAPGTLQE